MQFRVQALQELHNPSGVDRAVTFVRPRSFFVIASLVLAVAGSAVWASVHWLPVRVTATGYVRSVGGVETARLLVPRSTAARIMVGMSVRIAPAIGRPGLNAVVSEVGVVPVPKTELDDLETAGVVDASLGSESRYAVTVRLNSEGKAKIGLPQFSELSADIVVARIRPIDLVLGKS